MKMIEYKSQQTGQQWAAIKANDDKAPWAEVDLGKPQKFSKIVLYESGQNIKSFELQYKSDDKWNTFYTGTTAGSRAEITFKPIEAQVIRMVITSFSGTPGIFEISLLEE